MILRRGVPTRAISLIGVSRSARIWQHSSPHELANGAMSGARVVAIQRYHNSSRDEDAQQRLTSRVVAHSQTREAPQLGESVTLSGWLISIRPVSKYLAFAVLLLPRGKGEIQLLVRSEDEAEVAAVTDVWQNAGLHGVISVTGLFSQRPESARKDTNPFSQFELQVERCSVINPVGQDGLPFNPTDVGRSTKEEVRLRNRHLDLRNTERGERIRRRSRVTWAIRSYLHENGFDEIETPILLRSTPEGAREYLVPTRMTGSRSTQKEDDGQASGQPKFYALQQSPQQPKQLLVVSGVTDRYFQIARCFRDEDGRKDRQPEFTQVDMEMSFISTEPSPRDVDWTLGGCEVKEQVEGLIRAIMRISTEQDHMDCRAFPVMTYDEAMARFGSDKPDLRYGIELMQMGEQLSKNAEEENEEEGKCDEEVDVLCYTLPETGLTKKEVETIFADHRSDGAELFWGQTGATNEMAKLLIRKSGIIRAFLHSQGLEASSVSADGLSNLLRRAAKRGMPTSDGEGPYKPGERTCVLLASRPARSQGGSTVLGDVRKSLAQELILRRLLKPRVPYAFAWIIEFPLFTRVDEDKNALSKGRWNSSHHPFTGPKAEDAERVKTALGDDAVRTEEDEAFLASVKGQHYDLVLNGTEIGGGSVRIHDAELQRRILRNMLRLTEPELARFRHLLRALQHGAPPHAGIALGLDRLMTMLCDVPTIRDVIAFPKSAQGTDLLFGSPDVIDDAEVEDGEQNVQTADDVLLRYGLRRL